MNEKQIRDRIKVLQAEIKQLKAQLPKKERKPIDIPPPKKYESKFLSMANRIVNGERKA